MYVRFVVLHYGTYDDTRITEFPSYEDAELYLLNRCDPPVAVDGYYQIQKRFYSGRDPMSQEDA